MCYKVDSPISIGAPPVMYEIQCQFPGAKESLSNLILT